jgi:hypothetical protein
MNYIIVGAGPTGLTLAYCLGKLGYRVTLIDSASQIGGCHRSNFVNGYFTEHGPRIYEGSYLNFQMLLRDMGLDFDNLFTPYRYGVGAVASESLQNYKWSELLNMTWQFLKLIPYPNYGVTLSMDQYMKEHQFTDKAYEYTDDLCRITGMGADRFTMYQFLQLINQQAFYGIYQPKIPNNRPGGFLDLWQKAIQNTGNVTLYLNSQVNQIIYEGEQISSIALTQNNAQYQIGTNQDRYILAMPPSSLVKVLESSHLDYTTFNFTRTYVTPKDTNPLAVWAQRNEHDQSISIAYHWNRKLDLPHIFGRPRGEWGVFFIVLSDYMKFDPQELTCISTMITKPNVLSTVLNKTANQANLDELTKENYRQLNEILQNALSNDYVAKLNEGTVYQNGQWIDPNTCFVRSTDNCFLDFQSRKFSNLFNCGIHNGQSDYFFSSLESALSNALELLHQLLPETKVRYPIRVPFRLTTLIYLIIMILVLIILIQLNQK